ncbi:MAG: response regulator transcription factor [Candidatus Omnitrophica bacterium]|nr:response regulator transcription factor [Candidatus Omnitrophota bacterium]
MKVPKILIVDDEENQMMDIKLFLEKRINCEIVAMCNNCEDAMQIIKAKKIDVLLQDLKFPTKIQGYQVIDYVRKEKPDTIVLIISIWDDPDYMKSIEKAGSVYFIPKPLSLTEILIRLKTAFDLRGGFDYRTKNITI